MDLIEPEAGDDLAEFFVHQVVVWPFTGGGGYGDDVADPFGVMAWINDHRRLVRDANGQETISETSVTVPLNCPKIPLGSKVQLPAAFDARRSTVLEVNRQDPGPIDLPGHVVLALK